MRVVYAEEFRKQFAKRFNASTERRKIAFGKIGKTAGSKPKANWPYPPVFFCITRNYRVLFAFIDREAALFATIGHRKDIYRR